MKKIIKKYLNNFDTTYEPKLEIEKAREELKEVKKNKFNDFEKFCLNTRNLIICDRELTLIEGRKIVYEETIENNLNSLKLLN